MLRGTQVSIWQPSGIGESHESLQDFRGTVLQTHGDTGGHSLVLLKAQGRHKPGWLLS